MKDLGEILSMNLRTVECPAPLWKIKVTDDQYEELKEYLIYKYSIDGSFANCPKEAALYLAEWWKRDTSFPNQDNAFRALGLDFDPEGVESLFNNARRIFDPRDREAYIKGAKLVLTRRGRMFVYSLFYQGGFPMGRACSEHGAAWRRVIEKFVQKNIDFEELPGAIIAKRALREYKDYLVAAAREHESQGMPFACDEGHPWFKLAVEGVGIGDRKKEARPFSIKWSFIKRSGDFLIRGIISGPSELRESFLSFHPEIMEMSSVPVQLFRDDECIETLVQYDKTERGSYLSYYHVDYSFNYDGVSKMSLRIPGLDKPVLTSDVDMSIPHSFFRSSNGQDYEMGSKFGERVSLVVFDDSWELVVAEGGHSLPIRTSFGGRPFWMIVCDVPQDDSEISFTLERKGTDERYSFGSELTPTWTEVKTLKQYNPLIVEDVFDFSDEEQVAVLKYSDEEDDGERASSDAVFYRSKTSDRWSNDIPFGRIQCAVINNGIATSPERNLLSVGPGLDIAVLRFLPSECHYRIAWSEGEVYSADGKVKPDDNGVWIIKKEDYESVFPIICIPTAGEPFHLHVRTKYRDFNIYTPAGAKLKKCEIIPWSEVSSYRYVVTGSNRISVRPFREISFQLRVRESKDDDKAYLPSEGSLGQIMTPELLRKYEQQADIGFDFEILGCYFTLQRYPLSFRLSDNSAALELVLSTQAEEGVPQEGRENLMSTFRGRLLIFDQYGNIVHEIPISEDGRYYLPEKLDCQAFLACNQRGYVRPAFYSDGSLGEGGIEGSYFSILSESSLEDSCWESVKRFLDAGLRYGLPLDDLPWISAVVQSPDMFLALYCRLYIEARFDPAKIRDARNIMNRIMSVYGIAFSDMNIDYYLSHCGPGCFSENYVSWMHTYGKAENNDTTYMEFVMWAAVNVQKLITE